MQGLLVLSRITRSLLLMVSLSNHEPTLRQALRASGKYLPPGKS